MSEKSSKGEEEEDRKMTVQEKADFDSKNKQNNGTGVSTAIVITSESFESSKASEWFEQVFPKMSDNKENTWANVEGFDPMGSPGAKDTFDFRVSLKQCVRPECTNFSHCLGLCKMHGSFIKDLSDSDQALIRKVGMDFVESKRYAKMSALEQSFMQELHSYVGHPLLPFRFLDRNGFEVDPGYVPQLPGEETTHTNFQELSRMMRYDARRFLIQLEHHGFRVPDELKTKYLNLQPDGSTPKNWDFRNGIELYRDTAFRPDQVYLGYSEEYKAKKRENRKKRKQAEREAKESGTVAKKQRARGNGTCTECGKTGISNNVKRGRCGDHRTEESHPSCTHPGCDRWQGLTKGKCRKHGPKCSVSGCSNQIRKAGMCPTCYNKTQES